MTNVVEERGVWREVVVLWLVALCGGVIGSALTMFVLEVR